MEIGSAIRKTREAKGLSQKEVAIASKMDRAQYSRIENGKTDPSFSSVLHITKSIGIELSDLLRADDIFKDIRSIDKSLLKKISLIKSLDKKGKVAFFTMLDALVAKKKLKDYLVTGVQLTI